MTDLERRLPRFWDDCPEGWQNFIMSLPESDRNETDGYDYEYIKEKISIYGVTYIFDSNYENSCAIFESEEAYMHFRLKFGYI